MYREGRFEWFVIRIYLGMIMDCPNTIRLNTRRLMITHCAKYDYITWERVPKSERFNPLRYELIINPEARSLTINKDGLWAIKFSNFVFKAKRFVRA